MLSENVHDTLIDDAVKESLIGLEERDRSYGPRHDFSEVGRLRHMNYQAEEPGGWARLVHENDIKDVGQEFHRVGARVEISMKAQT
jgi:hypothetical protein